MSDACVILSFITLLLLSTWTFHGWLDFDVYLQSVRLQRFPSKRARSFTLSSHLLQLSFFPQMINKIISIGLWWFGCAHTTSIFADTICIIWNNAHVWSIQKDSMIRLKWNHYLMTPLLHAFEVVRWNR